MAQETWLTAQRSTLTRERNANSTFINSQQWVFMQGLDLEALQQGVKVCNSLDTVSVLSNFPRARNGAEPKEHDWYEEQGYKDFRGAMLPTGFEDYESSRASWDFQGIMSLFQALSACRGLQLKHLQFGSKKATVPLSLFIPAAFWTYFPRYLTSLRLHCKFSTTALAAYADARLVGLRNFLLRSNELQRLSVDCGGACRTPVDHDTFWTFLSRNTVWLQTLRVLELMGQVVRAKDMENVATASQLQELRLSDIWLDNEIDGEEWLAVTNRMGSCLKNLQLVSLANLTDTIALELDNNANPNLGDDILLSICLGFLPSIPFDELESQQLRGGGITAKVRSYSSTEWMERLEA